MRPAVIVFNLSRCLVQSNCQTGEADNRSSIHLHSGVRALSRNDMTTQASMEASQSLAVIISNLQRNAEGALQTFRIKWPRLRTKKGRCRPYSWPRNRNAANFKHKFKNCKSKFLV